MRKIREVLRLYFAPALSIRAIARSLGASPSTVREYPRRAKVAGLGWPLPESVDDSGLESRLFPAPPPSRMAPPLPDWSEPYRELRRKGVTLSRLWQEYKETHPEGLQYSRFCERYRAWAAKLDLVMRQEHPAGEKLFVDYGRADGAGGRPRDRRGAAGADLRGRARGVELHLRRGDVDADPARLDGIARPRLRVLRRVPELMMPDYVPRHMVDRHCLRPDRVAHVEHGAERNHVAVGVAHFERPDVVRATAEGVSAWIMTR